MENVRESRRNRVMVGNLPDDFLRVPSASANRAQPQTQPSNVNPFYLSGNFHLTIVEAELTKNYGLAKMDPYVKVRIGHNLYETPTDLRGGKHPLWNKTFHSYLPQGMRNIFFDIYDERALIPDERIAWGTLVLPDCLFRGEIIDMWVDLSGKQGDEKEGKIHVICSFNPSPVTPASYPTAPVMVVQTPFYGQVPYYTYGAPVAIPCNVNPQIPVQQPAARTPQLSASDMKQLEEMFPSFDKEVIASVVQGCNQNKDQAINTLLSMNG